MSGLNPFRPRKPEVLPVTTKSIDSPVPPPAATSISDDKPNAFPDVPHQNQDPTPDGDDSLSSDDGSTSDPFRQDSYLSENDNDGEEENDHSEKGHGWRWSRPGPDSHPSSNSISSSMNTSAGQENKGNMETRTSNTTAPKTSFPTSPTASSSSTDVSQQSARPGSLHDFTLGRHMSNVDMNSRALASRSANREKKPPPPPKNHHGKLINPPSQPPPAVSTNRFSFHGTPSEVSISHSPSTPSHSSRLSLQTGADYFSPKSSENENMKTPDTLRRSQSQNKRPPTPPLSRRHSQMRRSKSTLSQANPNRSSMPIGMEEADVSTPPSPNTISLTPSVRKPSRSSLLPTDENTSKHTPSREDHLQVAAETSILSNPKRASSVRRTVQGVSSSAAPPPPPPRRARFSNDGTRPTSVLLEKTGEEDAFPHPSNASNILDDLSRLQKEVDDLRGRYESRKASH